MAHFDNSDWNDYKDNGHGDSDQYKDHDDSLRIMMKRHNDEYDEYDDEDADDEEEDDKGECSKKFCVTTPWRAQCSEINAHRGHILPTSHEKPCHFIGRPQNNRFWT